MSITDVIKYESDNHTFIWKHPSEDFNTGSRNSSSTKPKKQFSSLMDRPWIPLDRAGMNLKTQNLPLLNGISK